MNCEKCNRPKATEGVVEPMAILSKCSLVLCWRELRPQSAVFRDDCERAADPLRGLSVESAVDPEDDKTEKVDHPPHYTGHPSGVECITIVEHFGFNLGNAIKYIWRAALKGDLVEDLKKARWYIDREIGRLEAGK
jgi:hypothetical protein